MMYMRSPHGVQGFLVYLHCPTELCDGGSLYDYVMDKAKPLELELAKKWAIGIAKGEILQYVHNYV